MADTFTSNYNLTLPEVGASEDTWGTKLNTNLDTIDGKLDDIEGKSGAGTLKYANSAKLATTSIGIDVTGTVTADGIDLASNSEIETVGNLYLTLDSDNNTTAAEFEIRRNSTTDAIATFTENGDISFYEDTGTTAKFFWDASAERLGVGTSTLPEGKLHVKEDGAGDVELLTLENSTGTGGKATLTLKTTSTDATKSAQIKAERTGSSGETALEFYTFNGSSTTEAMRIDSSGNLLVGTTTTNPSGNNDASGVEISAAGQVNISRNGAIPLDVNRGSSDGEIVRFRYNGITRGVVGLGQSGAYTYIGHDTVGLTWAYNVLAIMPYRPTYNDYGDNTMDLGRSNGRFDDIYATNGTIQTSDEREKQDIDVLSDAEHNVAVAAKGLIRKYRWKDAVAEKGDDARIHFGVIAQDLKAAFEAEGLDAGDYAMFIHTEWWETYTDVPAVEAVEAQDAVYDDEGNLVSEAVEAVEAKEAYTRTDTYDTEAEAPEGAVKKDRMGVRYPELLAFIIGAL